MNRKNQVRTKKRIVFLVVALSFLVIFAFGAYFTHSLNHFQKRTYEEIFANKELLAHYGIGSKRNPKDYGFDYQNITFMSEKARLKLHAWYIPSLSEKSKEKSSKNKADKVIFFVHGRQATRLKPMKYLSLIKDLGLHEKYAVFLPDFRNSGLSPDASTGLGTKFAEDMFFAVRLLHEKYGKNQFIFYSFSMGAMATMYFLSQPEYQKYLQSKGIHIQRIIMDSPMASASANVFWRGQKDGIPRPLISLGFVLYDLWSDFDMDHLRLSFALSRIEKPVLILQGLADRYTPVEILKKELTFVKKPSIKVVYFSGGRHVALWTDPVHTKHYVQIVKSFLLSNGENDDKKK